MGPSTAQEAQGPGGGAVWPNTSFHEMLEICGQSLVIQHLSEVKRTVRDRGHVSTRTSINPGRNDGVVSFWLYINKGQ